jgi:hypothetical protein
MKPNKNPLDRFVQGNGGSYNLNQHSAKMQDRRTKRNRDKSSQSRTAIDRSRRGE